MYQSYKIREFIKINEMYSLFEADYENTYDFPGESHNFWECVYVVDGSICVSGDDRIYNIKKNQLIFHKPLEVHKFHIDSKENTRLFIFSFSSEMGMDFFENKVFMLNHRQIDIINNLLKYLRSNNNIKITTINEIKKSAPADMYLKKFDKSPEYSQTIITYIYQLFFSLLNTTENIMVSLQNEDAKIFSEAVNYMNNNIDTFANISEIAKIVNTSPTTLKRIFAKYSGLGVHKYMVTLKINAAIQMIADGVSVTEISDSLGFSSQGYFSSVFKRELGIYPTDYKKRIFQ